MLSTPAKRHSYDDAARLAGELYGKILNRDADKAGFEHVLDSLQNGKKSVRLHAVEMIASAEFHLNFVRGKDNRSVVIVLYKILLARAPLAEDLAQQVLVLRELGLRRYADELSTGDEYYDAWGDDRVPGNGH